MEYYSDIVAAAAGLVGALISLVICLVMLVGLWKVYAKAGVPGWGCIIPIYNAYLLFKIAWGNGWLFLLSLIPVVNIVFCIIVYLKLAKSFGKGVGFGLGLLLLPFIFTLILGFGDAKYVGPAA